VKTEDSKKVLFIIHDLHQDDIHFPLGPAYLAAVLEKAGAVVEIYDMQAHHYTNDELAEYLDGSKYSLICVGFLSARFKDTVQPLLDVIAQHKNSGACLVLGGHGPSATPEWMLENTPADIICVGESEETIVELYEWGAEFKPLLRSEMKGIAYRGWMGEITSTERRKPVQDLDSIPFPAWHLFDMDKYSTALQLWGMEPGEKALTMITGRGCTNRCSFCYRLERGIRFRSVNSVIAEMKQLRDKYGITGYFLNDELFVASKLRLFKLRDALKENDLHIKFSCNVRVDLFDYEIAVCLKEIGCTFANIGFESTDQNVLDLIEKECYG
jgi:Fe-S oxidoreductase